MSIAEKAIEIIQARYDTDEYKAGIAQIQDPSMRIYGVGDKRHSMDVHDWTVKLWPEASEAARIAAAGHDWDRAFEAGRDKLEIYPKDEKGKPLEPWYDIHKAIHSANSVKLLRQHLSGLVPEDMMLDISYIVIRHELGGVYDGGKIVDVTDRMTGSYNLNAACDVVQQADSLSFFNLLNIYVEWKKRGKVEQKIAYMYGRVKEPAIRQMVRELKFENPLAQEIFDSVLAGMDR